MTRQHSAQWATMPRAALAVLLFFGGLTIEVLAGLSISFMVSISMVATRVIAVIWLLVIIDFARFVASWPDETVRSSSRPSPL